MTARYVVLLAVVAAVMSACGDPGVTNSSNTSATPGASPTVERASPTRPAPTRAATATLVPPPPSVASPKPPPAPTQPPPALPEPTVRHTGDSVRTNPDGSYHIADGGDGCTYVEVHRSLLPLGPDQDPAPGAVLSVTLQSYDCHDGYYHYTPSTGELTGFLP